jgi:hypothetical protein
MDQFVSFELRFMLSFYLPVCFHNSQHAVLSLLLYQWNCSSNVFKRPPLNKLVHCLTHPLSFRPTHELIAKWCFTASPVLEIIPFPLIDRHNFM